MVTAANEKRREAKTWWAIAMNVACTIAVVIAGVLYTNNVARDSERKWCGIVTALDDSYSTPRAPNAPPPSTVGLKIMEEMHRLRAEFHC